jgi:serine/threonine-protein kinase
LATRSADDSPRSRGRPDAAPLGLTVDYQPPQDDATDGRRVALVTGSGPVATSLLAALLRHRLLGLSSLFAGLLGIVAAIILGGALLGAQAFLSGMLVYGVVMLVACAAIALLAVSLRKRIDWTLGQLRVIELLLFGSLAMCLLLRSCYLLWRTDTLPHAVDLTGQNQPALAYRLVTSLNHDVYMPWALLIVSYGIFIPNRWQRCALVVGIMTLAPLALRTASYVTSGLPLDDWLNLAGTNGGFLMALSVALAIYGAHRIEGLQQEARQARKLGQYQLKERLGAGGMGEVYLAEHLLLRRACAVKLIRPDRACDARHLRRFEREVQTTATLTHPNTVQVFDYGHTNDGTFYYVMEYLPGLTLEQLVERHGPLPANRAVHFLRQVCGALREAHAISLIHRDIKPGNVMVCERGGQHDTAKLLDFGLVVPLGGSPGDEKLTQEGAITGTPAYMSPEQAGGQDEIDARCDIYSVGALAYFLLTGQPPFAGRRGVKMLAAHLYEPPPPLTSRCPGVPAELEAVVIKCLAKAPGDRYADVRSLDTALRACNTVGPWTEEDAAQWWQFQSGSQAATGSRPGHERAGRTAQCPGKSIDGR